MIVRRAKVKVTYIDYVIDKERRSCVEVCPKVARTFIVAWGQLWIGCGWLVELGCS